MKRRSLLSSVAAGAIGSAKGVIESVTRHPTGRGLQSRITAIQFRVAPSSTTTAWSDGSFAASCCQERYIARPIRSPIRVVSYVYDSADAAHRVDAVLALIDAREKVVDPLDVARAADRSDALWEAMLTVKEAIRVGSAPEALFDENGHPDFTVGALITEEPTGRRSLHVGTEALETPP